MYSLKIIKLNEINQPHNIANLANFTIYQTELNVLPGWWIPWSYLYDIENYIFETRVY